MPQYLSEEAAIGKAVPIPGGSATGASCSPLEIPGFANRSLVPEFSDVSASSLVAGSCRSAMHLNPSSRECRASVRWRKKQPGYSAACAQVLSRKLVLCFGWLIRHSTLQKQNWFVPCLYRVGQAEVRAEPVTRVKCTTFSGDSKLEFLRSRATRFARLQIVAINPLNS